MLRKYVVSVFVFILLGSGIVFPSQLFGQSLAFGLPFITNYNANTYKAGNQNFCVVQSPNGIMYFGNNEGILEFDGNTWNLILVTNQSEVHSLAVGSNGRIYVGGQREFGYLAPNAKGQMKYVSLLDLLPENQKTFNNVWSIYIIDTKVYFRSNTGIYIYDGTKIKIVPIENSTHWSYFANNRFWLYLKNEGLFELKNDQLTLITGSLPFKNQVIYGMVGTSKNRMLVFMEQYGMMTFDGTSFQDINAPIDGTIADQTIHVSPLPNRLLAVATRRDGLLVVNEEGKLLRQVSNENGLQDNAVWESFSDQTGNLWVALNNGISLLEMASPFSLYSEKMGISGQIYNFVVHKDKIYVTSPFGVFYRSKNPKNLKENKFQPITKLKKQAWYLYSDGSSLLASTNDGIFEIRDTTATNIKSEFLNLQNTTTWFLLPLRQKNCVLANTAQGLALLYKKDNQWIIQKKLKGLPRESLYYMIEDKNGDVWIDNHTKGVFRLNVETDTSKNSTLRLYGVKDGLPSDLKNRIFLLNNQLAVGTEKGMYRFNPKSDRFERDLEFQKQLLESQDAEVRLLRENNKKEVWLNLHIKKGKEKQKIFQTFVLKEDEKTVLKTPFQKIEKLVLRDILFLSDSVTLIGTSEGIYQYENYKKLPNIVTEVLIRNVQIADSVLYGGVGIPIVPEIPYSSARMQFVCAATDFANATSVQYQYFLEGYDENWSEWTNSHIKDFVQLSEKKYTFRVRVKDIYENVSKEATYTFVVLAPWYRSVWAYLLYGVIFFVLMYLFIRFYAYRLRAENERLERIVSERSSEVLHQKEEIAIQKNDLEEKSKIIEEQNAKLKQTNIALEDKVKKRTQELEQAFEDLLKINQELDNFTYRAAHDIKGPLARLSGLCVVALMDVKETKAIDYFHKLQKEAQNTNDVLLKLMHVYETKVSTPKLTSINLHQSLTDLIIHTKNIDSIQDLQIDTALMEVAIQTDPYLLKSIFEAIIENAIIFRTQRKTTLLKISYQLKYSQHLISFEDNGIGIEPNITSRVFEMFFRGTEKSTGTGLGLYIAYLAAQKLNGSVRLEKTASGNTCFVVQLPA